MNQSRSKEQINWICLFRQVTARNAPQVDPGTKAVDEVQRIRNVHEAMRAYARQAKNKQLEIDAAEIRLRAERRIGELMKQQKETVGLAQGKRTDLGPKRTQVDKPTLADAGIDKHLADRARKLAGMLHAAAASGLHTYFIPCW
jgi:hypothetical protein